MKWFTGIVLALAVLLGLGWLFRVELALFGINQMMASQMEIGPTQEINWSTGVDSEGRAPADRPPRRIVSATCDNPDRLLAPRPRAAARKDRA